MKLALFDCDGTLVDSAALIHEVMARTFVAFGHPRPAIESTKSIIGLTLDIAIARMQGKPHAVSFSPAMPATISAMQARRDAVAGSPSSQMPRRTVPTVPIPVQTA